MAQSDYELAAHISGLNQRTEINSIFDSILTHNSGSTAPTVTKAFMMWVDTSNATYYYLKMRNHDNTAWVTLGIYTVATKTYISYIDGDQTISGIKTFSTSPIVPTPTTTGNIITMGNILEKTVAGIGYGTGSSGTVTQLTSKSTSVTLNKPTGTITMNNSALSANAQIGFVVNNSIFTIGDGVFLNITGGVSDYGAYSLIPSMSASGSFYIYIKNITGSSLSESVQIKFTIVKGANA